MSSTFRQLILLILLRETVCQKLLSLNKDIRASSTENDPHWDARNAVDGNLTNTPFECQCCASTAWELSPWYELDLGREFLIERIHVLGIAETRLIWHKNLRQMEIFLAPESEIENKTAITKVIGRQSSLNFTLAEKRESRYVTLRGNIYDRFIVCELSVYGDCVDGEFGPDCGQRCHCEGKPCNKTTGVCPSGKCLPGFIGPACDKACPDGHFGVNCSSNCGNCLNGTSCTKDFGVCKDGCESGFIPPLCFEDSTKASCPDVKLYQVATAVGGASTLIMIVVMVAWICYVIRLRKRYRREPTTSPPDVSGPYELPIRRAVETEHQYGQTGPVYEEAESSYEIPK